VLEEEPVILPGKERRFILYRIHKRPEGSQQRNIGDCGNMNKGNGRFYGLAN
jgi:hypothetical protein